MATDPDARIVLPSLGRTPATEMDLEIAAHLQLCIDDLVRSGMDPGQARAEAERRVEELRRARSTLHRGARRRDAALRQRAWLGALQADAKFAMRQLRRNAAHSALAFVMLAVGLGLCTAMFTLVERVLLHPLPFPHAEQLVHIAGRDSLHNSVTVVSNDDWLDWRRDTRSFAAFGAYGIPSRSSWTIGDSAVRVTMTTVSGDFFRVLQPRFIAGRSFTADEVSGGTAGLVVSERFWRDYLGGDPTLSRTIGTSGARVTGVVADGAGFPADVDVWQPMAIASFGGGATRSNVNLIAIARLQPGIPLAQASADLDRVAHAIRARDPGGLYDYGGIAEPLRALLVEPDAVSSLRLLMACVCGVLLIVCANLAVVTLGRGAARQQEFAIRASLGAARSRLVVQLLVEHLIVALAGGIGGVFVAWASVHALIHAWGAWIPRADEIHVDIPVLLFAIGLSVAVGLLAGIIPALRISRVSLHGTMKSTGQNTLGGKQRAASALVVVEFALAVLLVTGAGLLVHSFQRLLGRNLGFNPNIATMEIGLTRRVYQADSTLRLATWDRLVDAYRAIPSVQRVGLANWVPLGIAGTGFIELSEHDDSKPGAGYRVVSEDYFDVLGLRVVAGRTFNRNDAASAERVVVVNSAAATAYWPGENPIGKRIRAKSMESGPHGEPAPWLTVIGVVSDLRQHGLESDYQREMYTSFRQAPQWRTTVLTALVRSTLPPARLAGPMRAATRGVDPMVAGDFTTLVDQLAGSLAPRRITMSLLSGFAALAMFLAALGTYAVLAYGVTRRSRELAMRAALGAQRSDLLRLVAFAGLRTACAGIAIGMVAALEMSRVLDSMLVGVSALDPYTFVAAPALLLVAALIATLVPAIRATRADPIAAMRGA